MIFYSIHFNRPDFIEIQKKCIDEIGGTLVVIKNSSDPNIDLECNRLGVKFYTNPRYQSMSASHSHGLALNFMTSIMDYSRDWCILDHDFFPLKEINFEDYDILALVHGRGDQTKYLWPGFMAGKREIKLDGIDFLPTSKEDTGAGTSVLIDKGYRIKGIPEYYIGFDEESSAPLQTQKGIIQFGDFGVHYLNGSEWMGVEEKTRMEKKNFLLETIKDLKNKKIG